MLVVGLRLVSGQGSCDSDTDCSGKYPCCSKFGYCGDGPGYCTIIPPEVPEEIPEKVTEEVPIVFPKVVPDVVPVTLPVEVRDSWVKTFIGYFSVKIQRP